MAMDRTIPRGRAVHSKDSVIVVMLWMCKARHNKDNLIRHVASLRLNSFHSHFKNEITFWNANGGVDDILCNCKKSHAVASHGSYEYQFDRINYS
jgi:hypothetical protein